MSAAYRPVPEFQQLCELAAERKLEVHLFAPTGAGGKETPSIDLLAILPPASEDAVAHAHIHGPGTAALAVAARQCLSKLRRGAAA